MRPVLAASLAAASLLAAATLGGCGSACQDLGDRVCGCQPSTAAQDACRTQVKALIGDGPQRPTEADQQRCQQLLGTCAAPQGTVFCDWLRTPQGKGACGLAPTPAPSP